MAATTAKTKKDVDEMSARERLYDSLSYSYDKKGEKIAQEFDKSRSAADRQALSRGMQRSSYNNQTLANIDRQKINALDENESAKIADYENRLQDVERQEKADEQWERQFQAGREDAAWNKNFQQGQFDWNKEQANRTFDYQRARDTVADQQWNMNFNAGREDAAWNKAFQQGQFDWNKEQANRAFDYQKERDAVADDQWGKNFDAGREDAAWNKAFSEQQYADQRADAAWQQAFSEKQWEAQQAQWREEFDYNAKTDSQKIAYNYVVQAAANGADVSDELLAQAGLSRDDYNAIKTGAQSSGGGSGGSSRSGNPGNNNPGNNNPGNNTPGSVEEIFNEPGASATGSGTKVTALTSAKQAIADYVSSHPSAANLGATALAPSITPAKQQITLNPVLDNPITKGWATGNRIMIDPVIPDRQLPIEAEDMSPAEVERVKAAAEIYNKKKDAAKKTTKSKNNLTK